jgi:hypothetical protein
MQLGVRTSEGVPSARSRLTLGFDLVVGILLARVQVFTTEHYRNLLVEGKIFVQRHSNRLNFKSSPKI